MAFTQLSKLLNKKPTTPDASQVVAQPQQVVTPQPAVPVAAPKPQAPALTAPKPAPPPSTEPVVAPVTSAAPPTATKSLSPVGMQPTHVAQATPPPEAPVASPVVNTPPPPAPKSFAPNSQITSVAPPATPASEPVNGSSNDALTFNGSMGRPQGDSGGILGALNSKATPDVGLPNLSNLINPTKTNTGDGPMTNANVNDSVTPDLAGTPLEVSAPMDALKGDLSAPVVDSGYVSPTTTAAAPEEQTPAAQKNPYGDAVSNEGYANPVKPMDDAATSFGKDVSTPTGDNTNRFIAESTPAKKSTLTGVSNLQTDNEELPADFAPMEKTGAAVDPYANNAAYDGPTITGSPTGFINMRQWLDANKGAGARLADDLAAKQANPNLAQAQQKINNLQDIISRKSKNYGYDKSGLEDYGSYRDMRKQLDDAQAEYNNLLKDDSYMGQLKDVGHSDNVLNQALLGSSDYKKQIEDRNKAIGDFESKTDEKAKSLRDLVLGNQKAANDRVENYDAGQRALVEAQQKEADLKERNRIAQVATNALVERANRGTDPGSSRRLNANDSSLGDLISAVDKSNKGPGAVLQENYNTARILYESMGLDPVAMQDIEPNEVMKTLESQYGEFMTDREKQLFLEALDAMYQQKKSRNAAIDERDAAAK